MRKSRISRKTDQAERFTHSDLLARAKGDAAVHEMTVLRLPSDVMDENDGIFRLATIKRARAFVGADIWLAVATRRHCDGGGSTYDSTAVHDGQVDKAKICAFVAVVTEGAAAVIGNFRASVAIDIKLDEALTANITGDGNLQRWRWRQHTRPSCTAIMSSAAKPAEMAAGILCLIASATSITSPSFPRLAGLA